MSSEGKKLAIGVFCVDWRLHQKEVRIVEAVRDHLGVDVVDVVSFPGPDGVTKPGREDDRDALLGWLKLLIGAHKPATIAIIGHYNCAGNNCDDAEHDENVGATMWHYKDATQFTGEFVALSAVRESDAEWNLKEVARA